MPLVVTYLLLASAVLVVPRMARGVVVAVLRWRRLTPGLAWAVASALYVGVVWIGVRIWAAAAPTLVRPRFTWAPGPFAQPPAAAIVPLQANATDLVAAAVLAALARQAVVGALLVPGGRGERLVEQAPGGDDAQPLRPLPRRRRFVGDAAATAAACVTLAGVLERWWLWVAAAAVFLSTRLLRSEVVAADAVRRLEAGGRPGAGRPAPGRAVAGGPGGDRRRLRRGPRQLHGHGPVRPGRRGGRVRGPPRRTGRRHAHDPTRGSAPVSGPTRPLAVRRALRLAQAGCAGWLGWLGWLVASVALAPPAAADNCGDFTDCFAQASSAAEAAFGLTLLAGLSLLLDVLPGIGAVKGGVESATGRDLVTGEELADWERALGLVSIIPGAGLVRAARYLDDGAGLVRGSSRSLGDITDTAARRRGDAAEASRAAPVLSPPPLRAVAGDSRPLDPAHRRLADDYADDATSSARRRALAEQLGEAGAERYLRDVTGEANLTLLHPTADADVAGYAGMLARGEAWPHAVAFRGSYATNVAHFDGQSLHIVEAKGGSSAYGDRMSVQVQQGKRISQTDPEYPRDVAANMRESKLTDGRNEIGSAIEAAYKG